MLIDKEKAKQRMVEFISNQYWLKDEKPSFSDVYNQYKNYLSMGSVNNYLEELIQEKKIQKERNGNTVRYGPPKLHLSTKFIIFTGFFTAFSTSITLFLFGDITPFYIGLGAFSTSLFWRFFGLE